MHITKKNCTINRFISNRNRALNNYYKKLFECWDPTYNFQHIDILGFVKELLEVVLKEIQVTVLL